MLRRYGDGRRFLDTFTPELQAYAAQQWERAHTGVAPTIRTMIDGYGEDTVVVWFCQQLEDVNTFSSVRGKLSIDNQKRFAKHTMAEYPNLKVSEFLLFFHRLKSGRYGRFYGAVDALFIANALTVFTQERKSDLEYLADRQRKQAVASSPAPKYVTYEEFIQNKKLKENEH